MSATVQELAALVGGNLVGDGSVVIEAARAMTEAGPGQITFLDNEKALRRLASCKAAAVVLKPGHDCNGTPAIQVADPFNAFNTIYDHLHGKPDVDPPGVDPSARIHPTARLGANVFVGPHACIGAETVIGDDCQIQAGVVIGKKCKLGNQVALYPNVVLYDRCVLGKRVIVHASVVLGGDGFGYRLQNGRHAKVPQRGWLEIGDDVEIGAGSTIDRGTFGPTQIGEGTKIDNLVQIGHNCRIGKHNIVVAQVGIGGSTTTGQYVIMAGQVGVGDHVNIGDQVVIAGQSGVINDAKPGERLYGSPARPVREAKLWYFNTEKVPEMRKDVARIKKHLGLE